MRHVMHQAHPRHKKASHRLIDNLALLVGTLQPLMTLPQIFLILQSGDASGQSIVTWIAYDIASVVLLIYGVVHKLKPIVVTQILWLIVQSVVVISIIAFD
ncbi:hypothetical protein H7200_02230 [Candidatus Saccharibacteria bacterium]|nr:hypothetical protein [Candidatus Saccharibacteria bacterium]